MSVASFSTRRVRYGISAQACLLGLVVALVAVLAAETTPSTTHAAIEHFAPIVLAPVAIWLFLSERYERTLAVLLVYLGCVDGVLKLSSGSNTATLGRDALLYAIVLGALARMCLRRTQVALPPYAGFVLAWIAVCVIQVANPAGVSILHSVTSLRQHVEFVPLFFFGYLVLRSKPRLHTFLLLLVLVAAVNAVVSLIQSGLSPSQLASWGPGYRNLALGTATSASRTFVTAAGQVKVRPPGLGGEDGFGGTLCMIALPAAIAVLSGARRQTTQLWLLIPSTILIIVGVLVSEERVVVVTSALVTFAFLGLTLTSARQLRVLMAAFLVTVVAYATGSVLLSSATDRYSGITPSHLLGTTSSSRGTSLSIVPTYLVTYPLGAGLGSVGPAAGSGFGRARTKLNGENEFNFLLVETGIPGLLVMLALTLMLIRDGIWLRRVRDPELQWSLMVFTAVLIALAVTWFDAPVTADAPTSPFLWLSAGCLAYWYSELRAGRIPVRPRRAQAALALR